MKMTVQIWVERNVQEPMVFDTEQDVREYIENGAFNVDDFEDFLFHDFTSVELFYLDEDQKINAWNRFIEEEIGILFEKQEIEVEI